MIRSENEQYICDGMCFDKERVLTEIFTLWGAVVTTGEPMGVVSGSVNTKEITRCIATISLQCRQQMTSYFSEALREVGATDEKDKIKYLDDRYPVASNIVKSSVGSQVCGKSSKLLPLSFYTMINKFCHVEEWKYPCSFMSIFDDDGYNIPYVDGHLLLSTDTEDESSLCNGVIRNCLEVKITKSGRAKGGERIVPASGHYEVCRVSVSAFANAARIFITECEQCQLEEIDPNTDQECPT